MLILMYGESKFLKCFRSIFIDQQSFLEFLMFIKINRDDHTYDMTVSIDEHDIGGQYKCTKIWSHGGEYATAEDIYRETNFI